MEGCPFDPTTGKMKPEFEHLNTSNTSEVQLEMDFKDKQRSMTDLNWDGHDGS